MLQTPAPSGSRRKISRLEDANEASSISNRCNPVGHLWLRASGGGHLSEGLVTEDSKHQQTKLSPTLFAGKTVKESRHFLHAIKPL